MKEIDYLNEYPFLRRISKETLALIDLDVLHLPTVDERAMIRSLADKIHKEIVIYKKGYIAKTEHLCRVIKYASLTEDQISMLENIESYFARQEKLIVAYEKPLTFASNLK
jgi:hypothetical protein